MVGEIRQSGAIRVHDIDLRYAGIIRRFSPQQDLGTIRRPRSVGIDRTRHRQSSLLASIDGYDVGLPDIRFIVMRILTFFGRGIHKRLAVRTPRRMNVEGAIMRDLSLVLSLRGYDENF